jgi:hypothetical protein
MKKVILSFFMVIAAIAAWASPVEKQTATNAAGKFMGSIVPGSTVKSVTEVSGAYYVVNFAPQGWAIVSADDYVDPIIGYSTEGAFDPMRVPDNIDYMLRYYKDMVTLGAREGRVTRSAWKNTTFALTRAGVAVDPLIKVNFNQSSPFNKYCPGEDKDKALVGCVAVAMSQAMTVQRYPDRPQGTMTYTSSNYGKQTINYDGERAYSWDNIISGANSYDEAARLLWHAGVSVRMDYGTDGSGIPASQPDRISTALRTYFGYGSDVRYVWKSTYQDDWERLILNELNAGRAVVFNGVDSDNNSGHSFNIDGFDGSSNYHVNWGWGGYGNGYFRLDNLRYGSSYYNDYQVVIVGIGSPNRSLRSIALSETSIDENLPAGSVVGSLTVNGETPASSMTFEVRGLYNSTTGKFAEVPFKIQDNCLVTTEVLTVAKASSYSLDIKVTDSEKNESLTQGFTINVQPWRAIATATSITYNRTTGIFTLKTKHNVSYTITDASGAKIASGNIYPTPQLEINKALLSTGVNTLELRCGDEVKTLKLTK